MLRNITNTTRTVRTVLGVVTIADSSSLILEVQSLSRPKDPRLLSVKSPKAIWRHRDSTLFVEDAANDPKKFVAVLQCCSTS